MRINEIFYSIQGEGYWAGVSSIFIRFSGCNQNCSFCDTSFEQYEEMSVNDILSEIRQYPCDHVVLTGGEPCLQITEELLSVLHNHGYYIQIETNGSIDIDTLVSYIDWVTCSPKKLEVKIPRIDEIKVVYNGAELCLGEKEMTANHFFLQPMDTGNEEKNKENIKKTIEYIKKNTKWRISIQIHKILNVR